MSNCTKHPNWLNGCEKSKITNQIKKDLRIESYNTNPKLCKKCQIPIRYEKKSNTFCSSSCSASYYTKGRKLTNTHKENIRKGVLNIPLNIRNPLTERYTNITFDECIICETIITNCEKRFRKTCSDKCLSVYKSNLAKSLPMFHGNKNRHAAWYESPIAGRVFLESSWERKLANEFDILGINWGRPKDPFIWFDQNQKRRRYYPDFYLKDFDTYLDPKNICLYKRDTEKLLYITNHCNIQLLVLVEECHLNFEYIKSKIENNDFKLP